MPANMLIENGNLRDIAAPSILGALSGLIAAATAADASVFAVRNISGRPMACGRLQIACVGGVAPYAAAAVIGVKLFKASGFTAIDTGGTVVLAQRRKTTGFLPIAVTDIAAVVATTGALTPGVRVLEAQPFHVASFGGAVAFGGESIIEVRDGLPETLEADEGIVAQLVNATPAGGTAQLFFGLQFFRF